MNHQFILGLDYMNYYNLQIDLKNFKLYQTTSIETQKPSKRPIIQMILNEKIELQLLRQVQGLIQKYPLVFSTNKTDVGTTNLVQHRIHLTNNVPINLKPYRTSLRDQTEINTQISELLQKGLIRPSFSPYSAPVTLAEKKNEGRTRLCIDYRKLNAITIPDRQPIPRIDDILDSLTDAKYFTTLDITSGYWHVRMNKSITRLLSQHKRDTMNG